MFLLTKIFINVNCIRIDFSVFEIIMKPFIENMWFGMLSLVIDQFDFDGCVCSCSFSFSRRHFDSIFLVSSAKHLVLDLVEASLDMCFVEAEALLSTKAQCNCSSIISYSLFSDTYAKSFLSLLSDVYETIGLWIILLLLLDNLQNFFLDCLVEYYLH